MPQPAIIFHHPLPIEEGGKSGSSVRPMKMVHAFEQIGYHVDMVTGYRKERSVAARHVINRLKENKRTYAFVYSESSTQPTLLTERHHLPLHPLLDFGFLRSVRNMGIPVGLFYRDLHWRTDHYRLNVTWLKRAILIPMHHYDVIQYKHVVDHLFLPDLAMQSLLPKPWKADRISALPPGGIIQSIDSSLLPSLSEGIQLLFVGGIVPPLYDLRAVLRSVAGIPNVRLTICCRDFEWQSHKDFYLPLPDNVTIVHAAGDELDTLYARSHIVIVNSDHWYQRITIPVKFFEAVGYGKPTILVGKSALSQLVASEGISWNLESADEIPGLLRALLDDPQCYGAKQEAVIQHRAHHSWTSRARTVEAVMEKYRLLQ